VTHVVPRRQFLEHTEQLGFQLEELAATFLRSVRSATPCTGSSQNLLRRRRHHPSGVDELRRPTGLASALWVQKDAVALWSRSRCAVSLPSTALHGNDWGFWVKEHAMDSGLNQPKLNCSSTYARLVGRHPALPQLVVRLASGWSAAAR
jgi:hypothetical protein